MVQFASSFLILPYSYTNECLDLLDECDIVVTNPMFSLFRKYVATLVAYNKKFIICGNNNAIIYKEFFPLLKNNEVWLGYTANKTLVFRIPNTYEKWDEKETAKRNDGHHYAKFPAISVFTNLGISKRHEKLILWKNYTPEKYSTYDNYNAINVNNVSEIPCDYCESWGVTAAELKRLDASAWEVVRTTADLQYIISAKSTDLREMMSSQAAGISKPSITKLVHDDNVTTDVLLKICVALDCSLSDIVEIIKEEV